LKPIGWIASSKKDLLALPEETQRDIGYALYWAQLGGKHPDAKPLKGFSGAGVLEVIAHYDGGTFRAVYTVGFAAFYMSRTVFKRNRNRELRHRNKISNSSRTV
jgi:phage-related protein